MKKLYIIAFAVLFANLFSQKHEEAEMKGAKKYARGGGIEIKGKTRGKMVKMAGGGSCK